MLTTIVIVILFAAIIYNLGAGLYFMMTDRGRTDRTVRALTRRIGLSVLLIILVIVTPDESSSSVLSSGIPHGAIVSNWPPTSPGPLVGHAGEKFGQR
jgi:branched-subunit amino acid transport protein AzlD